MPEINKFLKKLEEETNYKLTENLALTHKSSLSSLLDFFGLGGALRTRNEQEIISLFSRAFSEDPLLAMKCLFYLRDIRGGQGERRTFRIILNHLGETQPHVIRKNFDNIPFFGRWDDMYSLVNTRLEGFMFAFMKEQFMKDLESERPSLLGKWLKSPNTSSKKSRELAKLTRQKFEIFQERNYRVALSILRNRIGIVEQYMCMNNWDNIDYEKVPSNASLKYRKAFKRHDPEGYEQYLNSVEKGEKTIKTGTLYPYDLVRTIGMGYNKTIELQWQNLPNYVQEGENSIVVCDVSGSMGSFRGRGYRNPEPIYVSISLAIYFAERNRGPFENRFITFSAKPELQVIKGSNLYEKCLNLSKAHWEQNTDIMSVFRLILETAVRNNIPEEEMIKKIYIISDMEFDEADGITSHFDYYFSGRSTRKQRTNFQAIKQMYDQTRYEMPKLVFWNVDARQDQSPITINDEGIYMVSGCSPSIFESLMKSKTITPIDLMLEVLNKERYDRVKI